MTAEQERPVKATPLARRIAHAHGVDIRTVAGSRRDGLVTARDVEPTSNDDGTREVERIELSRVRRTTAKRLTAAWTVPVFHITTSVLMERAETLIRRRRATGGVRTTITDLLAKVCAHVLLEHPFVNARFAEDAIILSPTADIGLAIAIPDGLFVGTIESVQDLKIDEISARREGLVSRARSGELRASDVVPATFTISNLGMPEFGVEQFTAILNPPQAAILAVGAAIERVVAADGRPGVARVSTLTGTFDHRVVDGADAAAFLGRVKACLEEPTLIL